ncbi:hypothetical protein HPB52_022663 [Rhipicephalus sanguineus]|uniref:Acyltransferase 3 domain-containing protein n=1 Tax=Rhipicephalus sanguineus TaxID=34632 RepID=A0A9D4PY26_RHISA|nr:hypothetical protein HPB52_022663 [Rhipicephalus sanguineus]
MPSIPLHAVGFGQASVKGLMIAVLFLLASTQLAQTSPARNGTADSSIVDIRETAMSITVSTASPEDEGRIDYAQLLRDLMPRVLSSIPASLWRRLLEADVRPECTEGLLRTLRGFRNLEPWVLRRALFEFVTAFSATSNTRVLLKVADKAKPDDYALQFLHGIRFFSIVYIVMGHCSSTVSDTWCDGFFLCFTVAKQERNGPIVFIIGVTRRLISVMLRTTDEYYTRPYYHAVCYFGGCMTYMIKEDFREARISKRLQQAGWYGCVACGLFCVFVKFAWVTSFNDVPRGLTLSAAFFDRILWTVFLAWITLACSTGRGGVLTRLLSWNAYVPLSKLSFGVYLLHLPFLKILLNASRERMYWSVFNQVASGSVHFWTT